MTGALFTDLAGFLLRGRNADGGWGYYSGKATRLEPTSWALLALKGLAPDARLGQILETWPARQGLLAERPGGDPNYAFHALALLVLRAFGSEHAQSNAALIRGLQGVKGFRVDAPNTSNRQNNRLQGWSWIPATFSWVEPTAWALLALKKFRQVAGAPVDPGRLSEAETLLLDRSCVLGGWNYGNSNMFGAELPPYVPTTSVALLALQDRADEAPVRRSRNFLSVHCDVGAFELLDVPGAHRPERHRDRRRSAGRRSEPAGLNHVRDGESACGGPGAVCTQEV